MLLELLFVKCNFWLLSLACLFLYFNYVRRKLYWIGWQLPGPNPALPLLGNLSMLYGRSIADVVSYFDEMLYKYSKKSGMVRFWISTKLLIIINDPSVAYQVNQKTQLKSEEYQYLCKPFLRTGLFITNNMPYWRWSKKAYLLGLSPDKLKGMMPNIHRGSLRVVDDLRKCCERQESVMTERIFQYLALSSVVHGTCDFDIYSKREEENKVFIEAFEQLFEYFQLRLVIPPLRNDLIHTLVGTRFNEVKQAKITLEYFKTIVEDKKRNNLNNKIGSKKEYNEMSFLDHMMGEEFNMSLEEILAHMFIMVVAGTDTLATECTMLLLLLAQNPDVQQKLYEEIVETLGDNFNIVPTVDDFNSMKTLEGAIKETLRMFPAAPYIGRSVVEDMTITGSDGKDYVIPEGATIAIFIRNLQNDPDVYENPSKFDPDRWLPENLEKRPANSYMPFNNGPRKCLGGRYSMLVMKTMAVTVLRNFEVLASKECEKFEDIHVEMNMTVKVGENCRIMLRERRRKL